VRRNVGMVIVALVVLALYFLVLRPLLLTPAARFPVLRRELGRVRAGRDVAVTFPVRNASLTPLPVLNVETDCGCVIADFPKSIPPLATRTIQATFQPEALWSGPVQKALVVFTGDPRRPEIRLAFSAEIVPYVVQEPPNPLLVPYRRGEVVRRELRLLPPPDAPLQITGAASGAADASAKVTPPAADDPERAYRVEVTLGPFRGPGDPIRTIHLPTTDPKYPDVAIVAVGQALAGPVVSPPEIIQSALGAGEAGRELGRVQVFTRSGKMHVLGVDSTDRAVKSELIERAAGRSYDVVLRYIGGWKPGRLTGAVRIRTDDPANSVFPLLYRVVVK